jgi:methyl-accepting chemotaxis protein
MKAITADSAQVYDALSQVITTEKGHQLQEQIMVARANYTQIRNEVLKVSRQGTNKATTYALARNQMDPACAQYLAALSAMADYLRGDADTASAGIQSSVQGSLQAIWTGLVLSAIVGLAITFLIVQGTSKILHRVAGTLESGANQIASAASQISASSQTLAQGAGEQAAAVEESSASLEELASMSKRNAEQTQQCQAWMQEARAITTDVDRLLNQTATSIQDINRASEATVKVIKTIEEIAFHEHSGAQRGGGSRARRGSRHGLCRGGGRSAQPGPALRSSGPGDQHFDRKRRRSRTQRQRTDHRHPDRL